MPQPHETNHLCKPWIGNFTINSVASYMQNYGYEATSVTNCAITDFEDCISCMNLCINVHGDDSLLWKGFLMMYLPFNCSAVKGRFIFCVSPSFVQHGKQPQLTHLGCWKSSCNNGTLLWFLFCVLCYLLMFAQAIFLYRADCYQYSVPRYATFVVNGAITEACGWWLHFSTRLNFTHFLQCEYLNTQLLCWIVQASKDDISVLL